MTESNVALIAHLMRRAGFGATRSELEEYAAKGYDATVDELLDPADATRMPDEMIRRYRAFFNEIALAGGADPASLTKDADEGELLNPRHMSVDGISRYWRKRASSS